MALILEGIVTTLNPDGSPNVTPMGPVVSSDMSRVILRPFKTSNTYTNLCRLGEAVLHVTDNVDMFARAAVNDLRDPSVFPAHVVKGVVLSDTCRWYELKVREFDHAEPRAAAQCDIVHQGRLRDFFGFNRAKHAVLEAAILATRIGILSSDQILADFNRLEPLVEKTGGEQELAAFLFLKSYLGQNLNETI